MKVKNFATKIKGFLFAVRHREILMTDLGLIVKSKFVPCFEDEALGAVFSVQAYLVVFQHMEDFF